MHTNPTYSQSLSEKAIILLQKSIRPLFWTCVCITFFTLARLQWLKHYESKLHLAEDKYLAILKDQEKPLQSRKNAMLELIQQYPNTNFASFAGLYLSKWAEEEKLLALSAEHLLEALDHSQDAGLSHVIELRLARLYQHTQPEKTISILQRLEPKLSSSTKIFAYLALLEAGKTVKNKTLYHTTLEKSKALLKSPEALPEAKFLLHPYISK